MKKTIKLTESELHRLVSESVKNLISELDWRTYASAGEKAREKENGENNHYIKSIYKDQKDEFNRTANDNIYDQYGITPEEAANAKEFIEFYKEHGYYNDKLEKPSRKVLRALVKMDNDVVNFYSNKQSYSNGKWQNNESKERLIDKAIRESINNIKK